MREEEVVADAEDPDVRPLDGERQIVLTEEFCREEEKYLEEDILFQNNMDTQTREYPKSPFSTPQITGALPDDDGREHHFYFKADGSKVMIQNLRREIIPGAVSFIPLKRALMKIG
jgi:hypothetical protein